MPSDGPYMDYEDFGITEGSRVSVVLRDGTLFTGLVTHHVHDKKTGRVEMTLK